jgi:hypothetical protein
MEADAVTYLGTGLRSGPEMLRADRRAFEVERAILSIFLRVHPVGEPPKAGGVVVIFVKGTDAVFE